MGDRLTAASKFLSLLLRHQPEAVGLALDAGGWAEIDAIVRLTAAGRLPLTRALIERIVASSDKQRFALSADGLRVRANQGHSVAVDLCFAPQMPPAVLYHGTATRFLAAIQQQGLVRGSRQYVHLSPDAVTAMRVGQRHGKPVVLIVDALAMQTAGYVFYLSTNGVWLSEHVPVQFLRVAP